MPANEQSNGHEPSCPFLSFMQRIFLYLFLLLPGVVAAQMAEFYAGHQRTGVDLMWFKNFRNVKEERTPFLFFSRNRVSIDYKNSPALFGSTNAISYNLKNGLGVVAVASLLNNGLVPKVGVQYYKQKGGLLFFGWLVADVKQKGNLDLFGLLRFTPPIKDEWKGFTQLELFPVYTPGTGFWNITQRGRLGATYHAWAGGLMMDFNQTGRKQFTSTQNTGVFVRYEF